MNRPRAVVQVENGVHRNHVHVCLIEGVDGTDIAPIAMVTLRRTGHLIGHEVVDVCLLTLHEIRNDVAAHVMRGVLILFVFQQSVDKRLRGEDVVAHGGVGHVRIIRGGRGIRRLLDELRNRAHPIRLDAAKGRSLRTRNADARHRAVQSRRDVLLHHLGRVHAVDVVGAKDDDVIRLLVINQVQRLQNGIGRTVVPTLTAALLGWYGGDVLRGRPRQVPRLGNVAVQRVGFVLG